MRRWCLGILGGGLGAMSLGALASSLAPGRPINGIALGLMVSVASWAGLWVWCMATPRLGRCALSLLVGILLCIAWVAARMVG